jgi:hypothetical protein
MVRSLEAIHRGLTWRVGLPARLGLDHIAIHITAVLLVPVLSLGLLGYTYSVPGLEELRPAAATLPLVWLASLTVRLMAQILAIGSHGDEFEMVVGPTGNTSSDYELLSGPAILSYAMAGQAATLLLALLGLLVLAALAPSPASGLTLAAVFDFHSGWGTAAWASQVLWVNGFLFGMHLMPAAPFDTRALLVGWFRITQPQMPPSAGHRALGYANSHLAMLLAGAATAMIVSQLGAAERLTPWYGVLVISVYLLMISQFEMLRAREQEELESPRSARQSLRRDAQPTSQVARHYKLHGGHHSFLEEDSMTGEMETAPILDIDEILRKLHREGQDALSTTEKEALMSASRELKAKRENSEPTAGTADSE